MNTFNNTEPVQVSYISVKSLKYKFDVLTCMNKDLYHTDGELAVVTETNDFFLFPEMLRTLAYVYMMLNEQTFALR